RLYAGLVESAFLAAVERSKEPSWIRELRQNHLLWAVPHTYTSWEGTRARQGQFEEAPLTSFPDYVEVPAPGNRRKATPAGPNWQTPTLRERGRLQAKAKPT